MISNYLERAMPTCRKGDDSLLYTCPVCTGRKKLEVNVARNLWYCHRCGRGGTTSRTLLSSDAESRGIRRLHDNFLERYHAIDECHRLCNRIRTQRNLSLALMRAMVPHSGPDPYRIYFPCFNQGSGVPTTFIGRTVVEAIPAYLYPTIGEGRKMSECLWGLHLLKPPVENLLIVEGVFDAVHYPNAVAILGSTISAAQAEIVRAVAPQAVTVWLDEYAGARQAKVIQTISLTNSCPIYTLPWEAIRRQMRYAKRKGELDPDRVRNHRLLKLRERIV